MKKFRLLRPDEIECRVQKCSEKGVSLLLYKTARTDADLLDETVGAENWENDFKLVDGVLYGGLGVNYGNGLVWKWDAGTESNTEAEKGRASDAFKRAGFKHGIGRELYSAPFVWVSAADCRKLKQDQKGRWVCNDNFVVDVIAYDENERIAALVITSGGTVVYELGVKRNKPEPAVKKFYCADCGAEIVPVALKTNTYTAEQWAVGTEREFGRPLCRSCRNKVRKAAEQA